MADFDLSKITGREPPLKTDDDLPCACEWNEAGEPVGLCAAHEFVVKAATEFASNALTVVERRRDDLLRERDALRARVAELEAAAGTLLDLTMRKDEPLNSDHNTMVAMAGDTIRVNEAALWQLQMLLPPEKCGVPSAGGG